MAKSLKPYDASDRQMAFSRTALDEFLDCPRCFYQARRLRFKRPGGPMSGLPGAVDRLLKAEFDAYRERGEAHPVMAGLPGDLVPYAHEAMDDWRNNFRGVRVLHEPSGFVFFGAPDDVWSARKTGEIHVVDYKTSSEASLDTPWGAKYRRQVEVYQFLLSGQNLPVSSTAYFLFEKADKSAPALDGVLRFTPEVLAYAGNSDWVDDALVAARDCLDSDEVPEASAECELCTWVESVSQKPAGGNRSRGGGDD